MGRPPLSRLRRRFGPLRGTQRRCAALRAAPQGRYAPHALRAQPFLEHEKKAYFIEILISYNKKYHAPAFTNVKSSRTLILYKLAVGLHM